MSHKHWTEKGQSLHATGCVLAKTLIRAHQDGVCLPDHVLSRTFSGNLPVFTRACTVVLYNRRACFPFSRQQSVFISAVLADVQAEKGSRDEVFALLNGVLQGEILTLDLPPLFLLLLFELIFYK